MWHSKLPSWSRRIRGIPTTILVILPIITICLIPWVSPDTRTIWLMWGYGFHTGLCITAGYHRLWSHRAYRATVFLRLYLAIFGAGALQGPILWWAREHRAHHRYTDTVLDPYSIREGLFHSHMGWMLLRPPPTPPAAARARRKHIDLSDLTADPIVRWQARHFRWLAPLMGWILPAVVAGICFDDWKGGCVYAALGKMVLVHQSTFCINSLAHWLGDQPYDDRASPRDSLLAAVLTLGEGYHNFHHTFPRDYRNGVRWYHWDCTKWVIAGWEWMGWADELRRVADVDVERARVQELQKGLARRLAVLPRVVDVEDLWVIDWEDYQRMVRPDEAGNRRALLAVDGVVHDLTHFVPQHPGGSRLLCSFVGKDASVVFHGESIYRHSKIARNILASSRVAVLAPGWEVAPQGGVQ
ncbi:acyl-CoA desaturase [Aspergillus brunneoviolaceus CBS 621.78]|uniref:Uncharacterized protein n=1 Tax=Aspergillus brunneoviolaceus CBS 621.78 TaxID=1450534 RepID=A0ACD1GMR0_9EURO|nr:hypothetical protein BO95DRAFT_497901 [Aspergillus brunneoviolaceus CBS 621.78]RAH50532.1 hypothetical protein BO95DRAFT_497901 [Aspergillus brunneoviolaceus CBS 621.78]